MGTRPKVEDLVFRLYGRPLHPELFNVRAERRVRQGSWDAMIRLTDVGHTITWQNRDVCLSELASAVGHPLPEKRRILAVRLCGERSDRVECAAGVVYAMSFTVERLDPEVFRHIHDELKLDGLRSGLFHNFLPHHRLALAPLSVIHLEPRPRSLIVHTFHTFPTEYTVVKTQSLFEV